jgi:hypothetical protein
VTLVQEHNPPTPQRSSAARSGDASTRAIRDFVPAPISPARSRSPSAPNMSGLSASLATSSFHHPRARTDHASQLPDRPSSAASSRSNHSTSSSTPPPQGSNSNVLKFKRNINDTINTAASYRYFVNLEDEITRHREHREQNERKPEAPDQNQPTGGTNEQLRSELRSEEQEVTVSRGREKSKGKRKVTFDVEPEVVTINRELNEDDNDTPRGSFPSPQQYTHPTMFTEMIFELEDLDQEHNETLLNPSLPLIEQPVQPVRIRKHRQSTELSGSFSTLRPASLPAPSHIRPPKSTHGADTSSPTIVLSLPRPLGSQASASGSALLNPRDAEILKLVAANTPSHRGVWNPNSKAWQTFVRRQDSRDHAENGYIAEEGEEENDGDGSVLGSVAINYNNNGEDIPTACTTWHSEFSVVAPNKSDAPFVGSLPIPIKFAKRPQTLSLASYKPQTSIPERPVVDATSNTSTTALRKAVYAERDRSRSIDPGALDFEEEEEQDHLIANEDDVKQNDTADAGDRGRNQALKILQAGSEVPEAGMWRSLAT